MNPFGQAYFFQRGWNHQLELEYVPVGEFTKHQIQDNGNQPLLLVQEEKQNPDRKKISQIQHPKRNFVQIYRFRHIPHPTLSLQQKKD